MFWGNVIVLSGCPVVADNTVELGSFPCPLEEGH